jgi:hypothetical protein
MRLAVVAMGTVRSVHVVSPVKIKALVVLATLAATLAM